MQGKFEGGRSKIPWLNNILEWYGICTTTLFEFAILIERGNET